MKAAAREPVIECRGIWKVFGHGSERAQEATRTGGLSKSEVRDRFNCAAGVRDASFTVGRGEIFCIMGLSRSGKSTLIRHINRLIESTAGTIHIERRNVSAVSPRERRALQAERIGMVFQNMGLLPHRTVRDNVAFSLEVRGIDDAERARVAACAIEAVDLTILVAADGQRLGAVTKRALLRGIQGGDDTSTRLKGAA